MAARRLTTELRQVLHEHELTVIARVIVYVGSDTGRVEAMICWGSNDQGPSATTTFNLSGDSSACVRVSIEEGALEFAATATFDSGEIGPPSSPMAVIVNDPPGHCTSGLRPTTPSSSHTDRQMCG